MDNSELKGRTFRSVLWTLARIGASNVVSFIVFSVLARVLMPREFGVFALASVVVDLTRIVATAGLGDAVTRAPVLDESLADTAFWANVILGGLVGIATWLLAPIYGSLIEQPEVAPVLRCLALLVPISSLSGIHTARKLRAFGHKALAARMIASGVVGGSAAVAAALAGFGVWSLVIQAAIVDIIGVAFAWQTFPWRPRLRFDRQQLAGVVGFSASMVLTQVMWLMLARVQDIVIGRFVSVTAVGTYRVVWRMIDLIAQTTIHPIVGVSFVTFAQVQDDHARFRAAFLRMLGLGALFTFPAMFGFGVLADDLIPFLFGPRWAGSGPIAEILTLMAVPFTMNFFVGSALAARGRSGTIARVAVVQAAATLVLSLLAAPYGLIWVAAAYVLRAYATMPYQLVLFRRDTGISISGMMRTVTPPFLASLVMTVCLLATAPLLQSGLGQRGAYLLVATVLGCCVFAGSLLLFAMGYVRSNLAALLPLWTARRPGMSAP